jgi:hypothetical protein
MIYCKNDFLECFFIRFKTEDFPFLSLIGMFQFCYTIMKIFAIYSLTFINYYEIIILYVNTVAY